MTNLGVVPVSDLEWPALGEELDRWGYAVTPRLLDDEQCRELSDLFDVDEAFRSTIVMSRHAFGEGTYRYFTDPLPAVGQDHLAGAVFTQPGKVVADTSCNHAAVRLAIGAQMERAAGGLRDSRIASCACGSQAELIK